MSGVMGRPCRWPLCPNIVTEPGGGYCPEHLPLARKKQDSKRAPAHARGYDRRWQKVRAMHLRRHPFCVDCLAQGKHTLAEEVHHIKPLRDGGTHAEENLMSLCKACHSKRTAKESGFARD